MKKIIILFALIPNVLIAQDMTERTIKVLGKANKEIDPDEIELTILFAETENVKKENELEIKEKELKKLVTAYGIPPENLIIDNFTASRFGYYYKSSSSKIRLTKAYKLRIVNIEIVDELIIELFEVGADNVTVTNLLSEKTEQIKSEAIIEALENAKNKAELMVTHMGAELGKVISIEEFNPQFTPAYHYENLKLNEYSGMEYGNVSRSVGSFSTDIGIRKINVQYHVNVTFELE